jgi:hypothetical protein
MNINVKGVWWGCKYAILAMRKNPTDESLGLHTGGSIINVASFVAILGAATPQLACKWYELHDRLYLKCSQTPHRRYRWSILYSPSKSDSIVGCRSGID